MTEHSRESPQIAHAVQFVRDAAERGCRINHSGGGTCRDRLESARAAQRDGTQPQRGPRWGSEGETGAYRDRVAAGEGLCRGCRAGLVLDGEYLPPNRTDREAS